MSTIHPFGTGAPRICSRCYAPVVDPSFHEGAYYHPECLNAKLAARAELAVHAEEEAAAELLYVHGLIESDTLASIHDALARRRLATANRYNAHDLCP